MKRLLALAVVVVMAVSLLSGCAGIYALCRNNCERFNALFPQGIVKKPSL